MDFNKLIARVKAILLTPKTEWPVIAAEPATVADLYKGYIMILAAIPAIAGFVKGSIIGTTVFGVTYRSSMAGGLVGAVLQYGLGLVMAYVLALIIDALAPNFGAQKSQVQALKTVAYSYTASWVASIFLILPIIGWLIAIAGGIYGIYLLYLSLPFTMRAPPERAGGYAAVSIIIAIVLGWVVALVIGAVTAGAMMGGAAGALHLGDASGGSVTVDPNSAVGKLAALGAAADAQAKRMEAAHAAGDTKGESEAAGKMLGTIMGGGDQVEALGPDVLKPFVPASLAGLNRTSMSAERNGAMGMQVSEAHGSYSDNQGRSLQLEITDMGSAKGLMALAGWAGVEEDKETDHGYEKTYKADGRLIHEQWDSQSKSGEYGIVLGERFSVKVSGNADNVDQLKAAVASVNLSGLEALRNQGVKKG